MYFGSTSRDIDNNQIFIHCLLSYINKKQKVSIFIFFYV